MTNNPLIIGQDERAALAHIREMAISKPVYIPTLGERIKTAAGKRQHMQQMNRQSTHIPADYLVTFSVETGHPGGVARHMSMSSGVEGRVPTAEAVGMVAAELGFTTPVGPENARIWLEKQRNRGSCGGQVTAVNVLQLIISPEPRALQ